MAIGNSAVGVDIGQYAVKAVWAEKKGGKPLITRTEALRLPFGQTDTVQIALSWIAKLKLNGTPCVIGLSGRDTIFQPFQLASNDPRTPEQAVAIEVLRYNEMASDSMICGFSPFSLEGKDRRLLLAVSRPSAINSAISRAKEIGLKIEDIIPLPVALFNVINFIHENSPAPVAYLDIGHTATSLAVGFKSHLLFARTFPYGGMMFTKALSEGSNITMTQAENVKHTECSLVSDSGSSAKLLHVAGAWSAELNSCFSVYRNLFPSPESRPASLVLAGGAANLRGMPEFLAAKLNIPVAMAGTLPGRSAGSSSADFAPAAGLAVCGLGLASSQISLLPEEEKEEIFFKRQIPFWISSGAAALLILLVSLAGGYFDLKRSRTDLSIQNTDLSQRRNLVTQIERAKNNNEKYVAAAAPLKNMVLSAPTARKLISLVSRSKDKNDIITLICDAYSYFHADRVATSSRRNVRGKPAVPPASAGNAPRLQNVIVEGVTQDTSFTSVKNLIAVLKNNDFVASADLLSDDMLVAGEASENMSRRTVRFVIDIKLKD